MRRRAWGATGPAIDRARGAAAWRLGCLGLLALGLLLGSANRATAGNPGDLILNEFNAVTDLVFLKRRTLDFVDANVAVADDEINIAGHLMSDQQGPVRLTTLGTLPAGLLLATDYYIVTTGLTNIPAGNWIGLSLTPGGAKVDITGLSGFGVHSITLPSELGDPFFGIVRGNGGNWIELVVIADHLDIRGWTLEWMNADLVSNSGTVTFVDHVIWSDLRSGTIITIREDDLSPPGYGVLLTDLSYDPQNGDWWIHANVDDLTVVLQAGFKVDNDNWSLRIWDGAITCPIPPSVCTGIGSTAVIQDFVGEITALWGGTGGVGNNEVGKLEQDPSAAAATTPPVPMYNDGTSSTFGSENLWLGGAIMQDFSALRAVAVPALTTTGTVVFTSLLLSSALWLTRRRAHPLSDVGSMSTCAGAPVPRRR